MKTLNSEELARLHDRGTKLIHTLYQKYRERFGTYRYNNVDTGPQNVNMPGCSIRNHQLHLFEDNSPVMPPSVKKGSLKHRQWLFLATLTDRRQVSMEVYKAHAAIFARNPEWYTRAAGDLDAIKFGEELSRYKIGVPRQSAKYWIICARTLFDEFGGDPVKFLKKTGGTIDGIQKWKKEEEKKRGFDPLPGYGPKVSSLFLLYLAELGKWQMPQDAFPVDMHVQRLFLQYGALTTNEDMVNDWLEEVLRPFICEIANRDGLDKVELSHAFWQLGRSSCTGCSRKKSVPMHCPIEKECQGPLNSRLYFSDGIWAHPLVFMRKGNETQFKLNEKSPLFSGN